MKLIRPFVLLALAGLAVETVAHAILETPSTPAGNYYKGVMKITHGCDGAATHTVRLLLPPEMQQSKPMPKPGWEVQPVRRKLVTPYDYHGKTMTDDVRELVWTGGNLGDEYYDEFVFSTRLAGEPGQTLYVKTIQECSEGRLNWTEIPTQDQTAEELEYPAPALKLIDGESHRH